MAFYLEYAALSLTHSPARYELCSIFHLFIHLFAYKYLPSARHVPEPPQALCSQGHITSPP